MAVPIQNLRSGTATKRPVASGLAFGQVAVNYNEADPAVYLRGDANALIKISPVFVGTGAPNATPASGGSAGNSKGEQWLDTASSPPTPKVWNGSAFVSNYTFTSGTTLIQPLVTSGTINNGTISGSTIINATISGTFTLPSGVITSNAIANDSIVNDDINSAAAIVDTKLATISTANKVGIAALDIDGGTDIGAALVDADLFIVDDGGAGTNRKAAATRITDYAFNKVSGDITIASNGTAAIGSAVIVNADINASAAIAGTKISPDFGSQDVATSGNVIVRGQGDLRFADADSSNYVAFQAPATVSSDIIWTLPSTSGTTGQFLSTNGSNVLSWTTGFSASSTNTFTALQTFSSGIALNNANIATIKTATFNSQTALVGTSGSITINWDTAQNQRQPEPTGTITYTFTAPPGPCHLQLLIDSDGTSTAQTINWPGSVIFLGSTWSGANNKRSVINFWYDGTNYFAIGTNQA